MQNMQTNDWKGPLVIVLFAALAVFYELFKSPTDLTPVFVIGVTAMALMRAVPAFELQKAQLTELRAIRHLLEHATMVEVTTKPYEVYCTSHERNIE